jgi:hypothetical protein
VTFKNLQDEVMLQRFTGELNRASVKSWLNVRYTAIWNAADWYFKHVRNKALVISASDPTPTMPSDFAESEGLYDQDGSPLIYVTPRDFDETALGVVSSGTPYAYTVVDREIWLYPTPPAATFKQSYRRRLCHIDGPSGLVAAGIMVDDSDQPLWGAEFDYLLVLDAQMLGMQLQNDPTWADLKPARDELLESLRGDSLASRQANEVLVWGAG